MYPSPIVVQNINAEINNNKKWDGVILIASDDLACEHPLIREAIRSHSKIDNRVGQEPILLACSEIAGGRLIYAPTGPLEREYDDVRRYGDAAKKAAVIAKNAGLCCPLMIVAGAADIDVYQHRVEVSYFGLCQALWQPLEARESQDEQMLEPIRTIGIVADSDVDQKWLSAVESGRRLARDICGTEPERMAPMGVANSCMDAFENTNVKVEVITDQQQLESEYPLLSAVARASLAVERHKPCVIRFEYQGQGEIEQTLLFAGKGVTYDTGGADLKVGGHMAGMSRDKGGAAAVAGFMKVVAELNPQNVKVIAEIGAVRNSLGADAFVPDEIIKSNAGVRVRIGNTDAEGRLVLADLLSHLRIDAKKAGTAELFSVATLTGHAARAVGPYSAIVENGPARMARSAQALVDVGDLWGDPCEISRSRREDYEFVTPKTKADDLLSSNNAPSAITTRGHQFPMAFLAVASGLDKHSINSTQPFSYTHMDIAGSGVEGGDWQHGIPVGTPVVTLAARYLR